LDPAGSSRLKTFRKSYEGAYQARGADIGDNMMMTNYQIMNMETPEKLKIR
jgi:hypothetical protein